MRRTIVAAVVVFAIVVLIVADQPEKLHFAWTQSPTPGILAYNLYHSTNVALPFTQWERIAIFAGDATDGFCDKPPGPVHFYFLTASNCVGESAPFDR